MKKTLLGLLFLFTNLFYAQVTDIEHCSGNTSFNLTSQKSILIGNLNPAETTVSYHLSLAEATNNENAIANPTNYVSNAASKTIYARIDNKGTVTTNYFNLILSPDLISTVVVEQISCQNEKGKITVQATGGKGPYVYSINGGTYSASNVFTDLVAGLYEVEVMDANGCYVNYIVFINEPTFLLATAVVENQTITINATGGNANYSYGLDGVTYQPSNVFTNMAFGNHNIYVKDEYGCTFTMIVTVNPPTPLINGKNTLTVEFTPGQTLGDIVVEGQNIKWYSSQNSLTGKTSKTAETTLPLTTVLVDGVTYYASQTINGVESTQRLAVTAKSNGSLSNSDFVLPNFKFYPNPVHHNLSISNTEVIDEIEIFSLSGKSVLAKKINNLHAEIDLSSVSTGVYFLKVKSEGVTKSIKIVKE